MPEQPNISPREQQILLRLDALLDALVAAGFARDRVGAPMRLRLLALLNQLPAETLPVQLKYKISALVCQSEAEQLKFYGIFDAFVGRFLPEITQEPGAPSDKKAETPEPKPPEPPAPENPHQQPTSPADGSRNSDTVKAARSGPITVELHFRDDGYRPWNLPELEAVVRPMREKEWTGAEEWDIPNTIKKTIQRGGAPHFARRRRRKAPQYLFLIEQKSVRDHLAGFYADLAIELSRRDLDVEYYYYDRIPQKCWKDRRDPSSYTTIDRLNTSYDGSRLILIGAPDGLLAVTREPGSKPDQENTKIHRYPSELAFELRDNWAAVAMLNTRSTALWGDAELAMHQLFPIAPANLSGLGSLMAQWQSRISFKPYYWKTECPEPIPPGFQDYDGTAETIDKHIKNLKVYLGRQGYTWLCAIAVYPEIYWQLTKILHDEAISAQDVPDESQRTQLWHLYLLRLSRLPWLRHGHIPAEYRQELRQGLPAANAAEVRRQLLEVLQLDENRPPDGSYAEKDRAYTVALFDHERYALLENPEKDRLAALQAKLRKDVLEAGVAISDIEDAVGRSLFRNLPDMPAESIRYFWVLWVDDTPGNNKGFQEKMALEQPVRFVNATSTTQALEMLPKQSFDMIISDVSRFGDKEAGIKMLPRLQEAGISLPVIFFTHPNYVQQHQETLRSMGAYAVVTGFKELEPLLLEVMHPREEATAGAEPNHDTPDFAQSSSNIGPQPNQANANDAQDELLSQARSLLDKGIEAREKGDFEAALSMLQNAFELYTQADDEAGLGNTGHDMGKLFLQMNQFERAKVSLESALKVYQKLDFNAAQAFVLMDLGKVELYMSNYNQAEKNYQEALEALEELSGDTSEDMIEVYLILASIAHTKSEFEKANYLLLTALKLAQEADLKPELFVIYTQLGNLKMEINDSAQAVQYLTNALKFTQKEEAAGSIYEYIAEAETQNGAYEKAEAALRNAYDIFLKTGDKEATERVTAQLNKLKTLTQPEEKRAPEPQSQQSAPESSTVESGYTPGLVKFFILCSQEDERISQALNKHLAILRINKQISVFNSASDIAAGEDWQRRIEDEMKAADFVLPIVSVNLLASDYTFAQLQDAMKSGKRIVPILAKKVDMDGTGLERLKTLPSQGRWISDYKNEDDAYSDIVREIRRLLPSGSGYAAPKAAAEEPLTQKNSINVQQVRDLISRARLGDALKLLQEAMPGNNDVVMLQGRLSTLERGERLGILDRQEAIVTRNQITAAVLDLIRDWPGGTMA